MPENFIPLESIRIAKPCRADWDKMMGSGRARFCQTCHKKVYNLSEMTRAEAEELIRRQEGKLCVRFYQRADGTVMTQDCPVGKKVVRRPFYWLAASFAAFLSSGMAIVHQRSDTAQPEIEAEVVACPFPVSEPIPAPVTQMTTIEPVEDQPRQEPMPEPPPVIMMGSPMVPSARTHIPVSEPWEQATTTTLDVESGPSSEETVN